MATYTRILRSSTSKIMLRNTTISRRITHTHAISLRNPTPTTKLCNSITISPYKFIAVIIPNPRRPPFRTSRSSQTPTRREFRQT
jgi:hypothetical protein